MMPRIIGEPAFLAKLFPFKDPTRATSEEFQKRRFGRDAHRRLHRQESMDGLPTEIVAAVTNEHTKEPPHDLGNDPGPREHEGHEPRHWRIGSSR